VACGTDRPAPPAPVPPPAASEPAAPADSLVGSSPNGAQVWLVEGRQARDSAGATCYERGVEIRRDSSRIRVPLLYTGRAPARFSRDGFEAELWRDCRPMARYRIDLATGRPTKLRDLP
jgi:hypothetical protein